tara:strand:+ start:3933 stop:5615 length:1683 start_codon:yes stop_codon:yes gene_type:complete
MSNAYKADTTVFRDHLSEEIFNHKYAHEGCETWPDLANTLVDDVCTGLLDKTDLDTLKWMIGTMRFIPGGRYLYYAGRKRKFFNNCFLLGCTDDTREQWAKSVHDATMCLMTGGGIGIDYSVLRGAGSELGGTGGIASGPIDLMKAVNNIGRTVMQGGSRRSAIYASLSCDHADVEKFLKVKDWHSQPIQGTDITVAQAKEADFNYEADLDMTNISINWNTRWLTDYWETGELSSVWMSNVEQAMRTGEPGFSFNFFDQETETLRNACTEVTSSDDGDVCNLGSLNMSRIENLKEFSLCTELATKFLLCGTIKSELPYDQIYKVRDKNRRLGLGLMGIHEWLMQRKMPYGVTPELRRWLHVYKKVSDHTAQRGADDLSVSQPVARRAIAPTGSIAILASTTSGIEPLFAVAYKRRFLKNKKWHYQYNVDASAVNVIERYGVDPDKIESSLNLAEEYERRISFQADIQDFVDMSISSTINLPEWGTEHNNPDKVRPFAETLAKYAHRLRGFTCYPDGSRGGQPLTVVPYAEAKAKLGENFEEGMEANDVCEITGKGGTCGV